MLGGVEPRVDDGDGSELCQRVEQSDVERMEDLGLVKVLDDHGTERFALINKRRRDGALRIVDAAGLSKGIEVLRLGQAHDASDVVLVLIDLRLSTDECATGKPFAGLDDKVVNTTSETDGVVDDQDAPLRVIKKKDAGFSGRQDADGALEDALDDLRKIKLAGKRAT